MQADDEIVFGRALDESRAYVREQQQSQRAGSDGERASIHKPQLAKAVFELHGATLRSLAEWYPSDERFTRAAQEWESLNFQLAGESGFEPIPI